MNEIDKRAHSSADAHTIYQLLLDGAGWPTWSPLGAFELVKPGADGGVLGEVHIFTTGRTKSREEVVELIPDRRFSYRLVHGLPLKGYRADVELTPTADGTDIRWHSTFKPSVPGTGWFYALVLGTFIQRCADGLARHAAQVRA